MQGPRPLPTGTEGRSITRATAGQSWGSSREHRTAAGALTAVHFIRSILAIDELVTAARIPNAAPITAAKLGSSAAGFCKGESPTVDEAGLGGPSAYSHSTAPTRVADVHAHTYTRFSAQLRTA